MDPPEQNNYDDWFHCSLIHSTNNQYDIIILWRICNFRYFKNRFPNSKIIYWPHDIFKKNSKDDTFKKNNNLTNNDITLFDGYLFLSTFHKNHFESIHNKVSNYVICGNGINLDEFDNYNKIKKNKYSIGYFSNYSRGLIVLLKIWKQLKVTFPNLTLKIYYGRSHWNTLSLEKYNEIIKYIKDLKIYDVYEMGKVNHFELAKAMCETSIWCYPCTSIETFCITAIKAQYAGCIPVTSRIGALNETVHPHAPNIKVVSCPYLYYNLLLQVLLDIDYYNNQRQNYIDFAKTFTWERSVTLMETIF